MITIFIALKLILFGGTEGHTVAPQIEVSPVALNLGEKIGLKDAVERSYILLGPLSRFIRFLFHTLIWNWLSLTSILAVVISSKARQAILGHLSFVKLSLAFTLASGFIYGLNVFDNYWANLYLYKYVLGCVALLLGLILSKMLHDVPLGHDIRTLARDRIKWLTALIISIIPTIVFFKQQAQFIGSEGWKIDRGMHATFRPKAFISSDEFLAMKWVREHLPHDAIIASDRRDKEGWSGNYIASVWFGYSAYSGRQFYNEGTDYNKYALAKVAPRRWNLIQDILTSKDAAEARNAWSHVNADYLIISKRISPQSFNKKYLGMTVYINDHIRIIKSGF